MTGCTQKLRGIAGSDSTTGNDPDRRDRTGQSILVRMFAKGTKHLHTSGNRNAGNVPTGHPTAQHPPDTEFQKLRQCVAWIPEQIEGAMKPDLHSMATCTLTECSGRSEVDPPLRRARSDHHSLESQCSHTIDSFQRTFQQALIEHEVFKDGRTSSPFCGGPDQGV